MAEKGRPIKLTQDLQDKICTTIRSGNYIEVAAAHAGVDKTTLFRWLKRGAREKDRLAKNQKARMKKEEEPFVHFCNSVEKAQADAEIRDVMLIAKAAQESWQAAAWRLERKFPDRWGRKEKQEVTHHGSVELTGARDKLLGRINQLADRNRDTENLP